MANDPKTEPKTETVRSDSQSSSQSSQSPKKSFEETIAEAVAKSLETALPMAMMAIERMRNQNNEQSSIQVSKETCPECRQYVTACKGQHQKGVCAPKERRFFSWFPGVILNGVTYRSSNYGDRITMPSTLDYMAFCNAFESQEADLLMGRINQPQVLATFSAKQQI